MKENDKNRREHRRFIPAVVLALGALAGTARSQELSASLRPEEFGVSQEMVYNLNPSDFQVENSGPSERARNENDKFIECAYPITYCGLNAPIHLPSGVRLTAVKVFYLDDQSGDPPNFSLARLGSTGSEETLASFFGPDFAGGLTSVELPVDPTRATVDNDRYHYSFQVTLKAGYQRLYRVALRYLRQVSAAPASATFDDVPTDHPYFRHIEALLDSGITAGCNASPPMFCADRPISRGEMAVFLAKALGLHWP